MSADDRELRRAHPLVTFVDSVLEQLTTEMLEERLVGFTEITRSRLVSRRRAMEEKKSDTELQLVLFELEQLCSLIPSVIYGGGDDAGQGEFHQAAFPSLLAALADWFGAVAPGTAVAASALAASAAYASVI